MKRSAAKRRDLKCLTEVFEIDSSSSSSVVAIGDSDVEEEDCIMPAATGVEQLIATDVVPERPAGESQVRSECDWALLLSRVGSWNMRGIIEEDIDCIFTQLQSDLNLDLLMTQECGCVHDASACSYHFEGGDLLLRSLGHRGKSSG